ncbi:MAG: hypothetical protein SVS85_03780 [Candidatus Nanohaloarchaea archaeon]|nr:hypothetical protein [Candidatus Nanohaloarchaea archaeon]
MDLERSRRFLDRRYIRNENIDLNQLVDELGELVVEERDHSDISDFHVERDSQDPGYVGQIIGREEKEEIRVEGENYTVIYDLSSRGGKTIAYPTGPAETVTGPGDYTDVVLKRHVERYFDPFNEIDWKSSLEPSEV